MDNKNNYKIRSPELELLDLGPQFYSEEEYEDCLIKLDQIGRFLGGDRATLSTFRKLKSPFKTVLDVGCGGGLFTMRLAQRYPEAFFTGTDLSSEAISFANKQLQQKHSDLNNITFQTVKVPALDTSIPYDIITSTLVCHHLDDIQLIDFLKRAYKIAKKAIIVNDLHRHRLAYISFRFISPLVFPNRLIQNDGLLSIKRAFTKKEWMTYLKAAEIPLEKCTLTWHWAFRWVLLIEK